MEFGILGPLEIRHADERAGVGGGRQRSLLALLLLAANDVVSSERLADALWDGRPPSPADQAVRVYVSRLRKVLGRWGDADVLVTCPPGYVLRVATDAVDAARFETLLTRGQVSARAGDPRAAAATLREALGLWRAPALVDVADLDPIVSERTRLEELRLAALEERIDADLACGRHREVVAEIGALVGAHPLRERLWGARMLALYRSGRQAEALGAYQEVRRQLREGLGIEPESSLQQLERAILRHEPHLDWDANGPGRGPVISGPASHAAPLPGFLTGTRGVFVGRAPELHGLAQARHEAGAGERRLVLIGGEPGVGKTRLVAEASAAAHAEGMAVLGGRCDEDLGMPYPPFVEALRHFIAHCPPGRLATLAGAHAGDLARLAPELPVRLGELPPPLRADPATERYRLFEAVVSWVAAVASDRPVLLVVDDLQWADRPTLLLLRHLIRSAEPAHLLVVATYRDSEVSHASPLGELLADLRREPGVERFALGGLDEAAVAEFVDASVGHVPSPLTRSLARTIHAETDGNPFFVGEVIRLWRETGSYDAVGVPDGVREVVKRRLGRLSEPARLVLNLAAVAAPDVEVPVVAATGLLDEAALIEAVEEAEAARLLVEVPGPAGAYQFVHALVRAAIYDELSGPRRRFLHRCVGEAMERLGAEQSGRLRELARHFTAAADGPDERAKTYTIRAAESASAVLAHEEAAAHYERALQLVGPGASGAQGVELLLLAAVSHRRAGELDRARQLFVSAFDAALGCDDVEQLARAALGVGEVSPVWGLDDELAGLLRTALARVGEDRPALTSRLLARLAQALYYTADSGERSDLSRQAVATARRSGDPEALAAVLSARHVALWGPDDVEARLAVADEVVGLARRLAHPELELQGHAWRVVDLFELGEVEAGDAAIAEHARLAAGLHQPAHRRDQALWNNMRAMLDGRFDEAEGGVDQLFGLSEPAGDQEATLAWCQRWWLVCERGRREEMADLAPRLVELVDRQGPARRAWSAGVSLHFARLGDQPAARAFFDDVAGDGFVGLPRDAVWLNALTHLAEAAALLDEEASAAELYELLLPYADRLALLDRAVLCKAAVPYYLGLLATTLRRWRPAVAHFEAALERHRSIGSRPLVARTECEYARMLLARGDDRARAAAGSLAAHARAEAHALGMAGVAARAG